MTPILYEKDEIDFTSQGLGSLVEIYDVDVAEQRNGLLQLTASYPVTGVRYDDISVGRIILAKPNQRDEPHAFRITSTDLDIMGHNVMIEADSITYDLNHNIVKHLSVSGADGQTMMSALKNAIVNPSIFNFYSDITHVSSTSLDYVNPMEAVMGVKGSFLQIWGGELKRENRRVAMFNRRGRDNVATFRLGKNISGLKYKVDISSLVTRILPIKSVQENDTTTYLEGTPVSSQYINSYEQIYTIKVDFTDDTIKTVDDLNRASANWFVESANTARDKPSVTIDIDVLSLQDSADYQDKFKDLESVALTDTVTVYVPEYGINVTAIVNELHFDPIQERVTKLTVGTARMSFADSSRVQLSYLQDKVISVQEQANQTAISANGKNTNYYGSVEPSHPQAGDLWYWKNGDLSGIKQFINGEWADWVDSNTQQHIIDSVDQALTEAKAYSDQLVADNVAQVNTVLDDVQAKQADLTAQQAELETKAQGYANKALDDAKADTLATAAQIAKDAQEYTDTAKAEAISVSTTADGAINKKIDDTASSIMRTISQNKSDADGKISTAQSTATQALNGLTTKVSQTVYDAKTGQLQTDLNTTTTTANQAKTDIVAIKSDNTKQDARMTTIESDANGTKTTVSNLQTDLGKANGSISTLEQRADGFDATVTRVNNLSVGGRNLIVRTGEIDGRIIGTGGSIVPWDNSAVTPAIIAVTPGKPLTMSGTAGGDNYFRYAFYDAAGKTIMRSASDLRSATTVIAPAESATFRISYPKEAQVKLERGNIATDWTPAPEDTDNKISTVSQTVDSISSIVSDPATGLTKRVQTAEGSISTVQSNVSDLQSKQTQTASGLTTEISDRQKGDTNTLTQAKDFTTSSISNSESGMRSQITQTSNAILGKIGAVNLFPNSEFEKDYGYRDKNGSVTTLSLRAKLDVDGHLNGVVGVVSNTTAYQGYWARNIPVYGGHSYSASVLVQYINGGLSNGRALLDVWFVDKDGNRINKGTIGTGGSNVYSTGQVSSPYWVKLYIENVIAPTNAVNMQVSLLVNDAGAGQAATFTQPMLTATEKLQTYTPNNDITTQLALLKDNWSIGIADNAGALASGIAGDLNGMTLISKKITLDGNTTVTGDFYAKGGNFKNLNASNMTVGTLNGTNVNITNINANNIVSGAISGANLNINLNTGSVVFQKGRINSSDYTTDINIDQGYISTANSDTRAILKNGQLQLTSPNYYDLQTNPYLSIYNDPRAFDSTGKFNSAIISARDRVIIGNKDGLSDMFWFGDTFYFGQSNFYGLSSGTTIGKAIPTTVGGGKTGVVLVGGSTYTNVIGGKDSPSITVGWSPDNIYSGNRVMIEGDYVHIPSIYNRTWSTSANVYVAPDGSLYRTSSAKKYKQDIKHDVPLSDSEKLIKIPLSTWIDKRQYREKNDETRYFGMIAEDLRDAGLEYLVQYGDDNEVEGINYDRVALLLIPLVKELKERIEKLESKGK